MKQWKFLSGYVRIGIRGTRVERTVNALIAEGIAVHDIIKLDGSSLTAYIRTKKLPAAKEIAEDCGCELKLIAETGLTKAKHLVLSRLSLFVTLMLGLTVLLIMSRLVLFIEIDGCDVIDRENVSTVLAESGIHIGMHLHDIDYLLVRENLLRMDERICYADIRPNGVLVKVVIREANSIVDKDDDTTPASIYADKDCTIISIVAEDGRALVTKGQTVKRGTLLISGDITPEGSESNVFVRAKGEIIAEVAYRFTSVVEPMATKLIRTGNSLTINRIEAMFVSVTSSIPYRDYEQEFGSQRVLTPAGIPVTVTEGTAYELIPGEAKLSRDEMEQQASFLLEEKLKRVVPGDARITAKKTEYIIQDDGTMLAIMNIITIESIGCARCIQTE